MEIFGILCAIPVSAGLCSMYCAFVSETLRKMTRLYGFLYWPSLLVLALFACEVILLASLGALRCDAAFGRLFTFMQLSVCLFGTPALANVLVLRPINCKWYVAAIFCTIFAVGLILLQYGIGEAIHGIN